MGRNYPRRYDTPLPTVSRAAGGTSGAGTRVTAAAGLDAYHSKMPHQHGDAAGELELRDYLKVFRRRKGTIVLCVLVALTAALGASFLQTPIYEGTAEVVLQTRQTDSLFNPNTGQPLAGERAVETELKILKGEPVRAEVRRRLGAAPAVSANAAGDTDVIEVRAQSTDAARAAAVANAYADAYIDFRRKQAVDDVLAAAQQIQGKVGELQKQAESLPPGAQKDALTGQQALFKQKLDQLQVDAALKTGGAQLVTSASTPDTPIKPTPVRNGVLAAFLGLVLGLGLAFLVEYLDDSLKTKDDLARVAPEVPVIGLIPAVTNWKPSEGPRVVSLLDPKSPAAEAYRTVRTSIQFLSLERPTRTLQVTSPSAQEGKSTTLANLAVALARAGQRVVLVCCDLRRPRIHEFFGLTNTTGFTSVLLGKVPLSAALQPVADQPRLSLLSSGPLPPNPSELLSSRRTVDVLTSLQAEADIVLIDSPPVLPVTDALVLSGRVDATLLVCVAGATTRKDAGRAVELLQQIDAPLVGTILNGITADSGYGYDYGYRYHYEPFTSQSPGKEPARPERTPAAKK